MLINTKQPEFSCGVCDLFIYLFIYLFIMWQKTRFFLILPGVPKFGSLPVSAAAAPMARRHCQRGPLAS
jgi:hypothetical protein